MIILGQGNCVNQINIHPHTQKLQHWALRKITFKKLHDDPVKPCSEGLKVLKFPVKGLKLLKFKDSLHQSQSGTLYQSSNNYPDGDIVTRSSNFYFSFEGDGYRFRKPNLFIFISAREFSFLHFTFNLLKIFTKF